MKKSLVWILVFALLITGCISVYALTDAEDKNAPVKDAPVRQTAVSSETLPSEEPSSELGSESSAAADDTIPEPVFESEKDEIVYKMLNSVDFYDTASVRFSALHPNIPFEQNYSIETDLTTGISHQVCSDNALLSQGEITAEAALQAYETYSDGKSICEYDNLNRTVRALSPTEPRTTADEEWPDGIRHYIDDNGEPHYRYRSNPTNADMAGECLFPQAYAFAYLMDQELWTIEETVRYLERDCVVLEGTVTETYSSKTGASTFTMYVDRATGILLKLEGRDASGSIANSVTVSEIHIDDPSTESALTFDMSKYSDYTSPTDHAFTQE